MVTSILQMREPEQRKRPNASPMPPAAAAPQ